MCHKILKDLIELAKAVSQRARSSYLLGNGHVLSLTGFGKLAKARPETVKFPKACFVPRQSIVYYERQRPVIHQHYWCAYKYIHTYEIPTGILQKTTLPISLCMAAAEVLQARDQKLVKRRNCHQAGVICFVEQFRGDSAACFF